jgi:hypothetical protein
MKELPGRISCFIYQMEISSRCRCSENKRSRRNVFIQKMKIFGIDSQVFVFLLSFRLVIRVSSRRKLYAKDNSDNGDKFFPIR